MSDVLQSSLVEGKLPEYADPSSWVMTWEVLFSTLSILIASQGCISHGLTAEGTKPEVKVKVEVKAWSEYYLCNFPVPILSNDLHVWRPRWGLRSTGCPKAGGNICNKSGWKTRLITIWLENQNQNMRAGAFQCDGRFSIGDFIAFIHKNICLSLLVQFSNHITAVSQNHLSITASYELCYYSNTYLCTCNVWLR